MNDLEKLFRQSNSILYGNKLIDLKEMKDVVLNRINFAKSISVTDSNNSEFDKLISSLEYSIENSDDLMALSIIGKINSTLSSITESFDNMTKMFHSHLK